MKLLLLVGLFMSSLWVLSWTVPMASIHDRVDVYVLPGCGACAQAERSLYNAHIAFNEREFKKGMVAAPTLYINGKYYGVGVDAVEQYIQERQQ